MSFFWLTYGVIYFVIAFVGIWCTCNTYNVSRSYIVNRVYTFVLTVTLVFLNMINRGNIFLLKKIMKLLASFCCHFLAHLTQMVMWDILITLSCRRRCYCKLSHFNQLL